MTPEQLNAIRARRAAITPGKWKVDEDRIRMGDIYVYIDNAPYGSNGSFEIHTMRHKLDDARFIAAAPDDIDTLLAYIAELEAKLGITNDSINNGKCL